MERSVGGRRTWLKAGAALAALPLSAWARWQPERPIRLMVPFPAGGASDTMVRIVCAEAGNALGTTLVVENRAGASGRILYEALKAAPPDGYTLGYFSSTVAVVAAVSRQLNFDVVKDFKPVVLLADFTSVMAVHSSVPVKTFGELVAYGKAHPGKLSYGSYGVNTQGHLNMENIRFASGIDMVHVPFKGEADTLQALLRGDVQVANLVLPPQQYLERGQIRLVGSLGRTRHPLFPNVPTLMEQGFNVSSETWMGVAGPAALPDEMRDVLFAALSGAVNKPAVQQRLAGLGMRSRGAPAAEVSASLRHDMDFYARIVRDAGLQLE